MPLAEEKVSVFQPLHTSRDQLRPSKQRGILCPMNWPKIFVAVVCLSLAGCKADYPLKAFVKDGHLYLDGAEHDWFLGRTGFCPKYLSVQSQSGETVWRVERVPRLRTH